VGDQIYPNAKRVYFQRFQQLLFGETLKCLTDNLEAVSGKSAANAPNDAYERTYNELKAYLITTEPADHDKSTKEFLTPVLLSHWIADRDIDKGRRDLASAQFDFYATELARENPFSAGNSKLMIEQARAYLAQFGGIDRYYVQLLSKASEKNPDVSFNDQYRDSAGVIVSNHKVKGAFTRGGFLFVQDALKDPRLYMGGEEWVLGKSATQAIDLGVVQQKLTERYDQDFVNEWNTVLKSSSVAGYASNADADRKLEKLTGPTSPLLELLYFISHNTDVAPADAKAHFAPVQAVEQPGPPDKAPDHYVLASNKEYVEALGKLQSDIHALAQNPGAPDPAQLAQAGNSADAASSTVTKIIASVPVDQEFGNQDQVRRLLQEPIKNTEALLRRGPMDIANGSGKSYCSQFAAVVNKYPFDPNAPQDASMDQLYAIFGPTGDAWKKLNDDVKPFVLKSGSRYVANPSASVKVSPSFLSFLNRVGSLSETLYPSGSPPPRFSYTLKQMPSNLEGVEVKIGTEKLAGAIVWTGASDNVDVATRSGDPLDSFSGPWAVFKFVARARQLGGGKLEWVSETNGRTVMLPNGKQKSYDYQLQVSGSANPFFDLQGMRCVSQVAGH
jgi:type VI secretion system protein ImpL